MSRDGLYEYTAFLTVMQAGVEMSVKSRPNPHALDEAISRCCKAALEIDKPRLDSPGLSGSNGDGGACWLPTGAVALLDSPLAQGRRDNGGSTRFAPGGTGKRGRTPTRAHHKLRR
jgi:hypothetical protein